MFDNIGGKIKSFARIVCILGIISSIVVGLICMGTYGDEGGFIFGPFISIFGAIFSYLGSFFAYGFGELVENSEIVAEYYFKLERNSKSAPAKSESKSGYSLTEMSMQHNNNSPTWKCSICGESNPRSSRICKSCGKDK